MAHLGVRIRPDGASLGFRVRLISDVGRDTRAVAVHPVAQKLSNSRVGADPWVSKSNGDLRPLRVSRTGTQDTLQRSDQEA